MRKSAKIALCGMGLIAGVIALSSCTASFCSVKDSAKILYTFDRGVTKYWDAPQYNESGALISEEFDLYGLKVYATYDLANSYILREKVLPNYASNKMFIPSMEFFKVVDRWTLELATTAYIQECQSIFGEGQIIEIDSVGEIASPTDDTGRNYITNYFSIEEVKNEKGEIIDYKKNNFTLYGILNTFGYLKFYDGNHSSVLDIEAEKQKILFKNYDKFIDGMRNDPSSYNIVPGADFFGYYKNQIQLLMNTYRSCIYTVGKDGDMVGMYGDRDKNGYYEQIQIDKKDYGYAWSKGFLEGLLIWPISYVVDSFTVTFAGTQGNLINGNGWAQVGAILLATIVIRLIIMLLSLKSTLSQGKMTKLQPELARLQEKYPNSKTNNYEKQRLAQEQMALYKKHKIRPFGQIIVLILQFPIFICVWGAFSGSAAVGTGTFYNMNLSDTIWNTLCRTSGLPTNINGWWTAFALILIMTALQVFATILPMIIQKKQRKKVAKLGKNPSADSSARTMKIVQFVMLAFIVVMGFTLPSAMGVYWIGGAVFSIFQTLLTQYINNRKPKSKKGKK